MFIIMTGEPVNGFDYIGPFKYFTSAKEYANYYLKNDKLKKLSTRTLILNF
jgi:hypothetical protein